MPEDGIINYVGQGSRIGMIVLLVVAAGALSFDAHRGLATFYRARATGPFALIWPRFVATATLAVIAYVLGTAAAWFETSLLLGALPADKVLWGLVLEAGFLVFAAPAALVADATLIDHLRPMLVSPGATVALLILAVHRARVREL